MADCQGNSGFNKLYNVADVPRRAEAQKTSHACSSKPASSSRSMVLRKRYENYDENMF